MATTRRKPPARRQYGDEVPTQREVEDCDVFFDDDARALDSLDVGDRQRALGRLLGREVR